jgi:hypothetical protein
VLVIEGGQMMGLYGEFYFIAWFWRVNGATEHAASITRALAGWFWFNLKMLS